MSYRKSPKNPPCLAKSVLCCLAFACVFALLSSPLNAQETGEYRKGDFMSLKEGKFTEIEIPGGKIVAPVDNAEITVRPNYRLNKMLRVLGGGTRTAKIRATARSHFCSNRNPTRSKVSGSPLG